MKELHEAISAVEEGRFSDFSKIVKKSLEDKYRENTRVQEMVNREMKMKNLQDAFREISRSINEGKSVKSVKAFMEVSKIKYKGKTYDLGKSPTGYITISGDVYDYDNTYVLSLKDDDKVVIYDSEGTAFDSDTFKEFKKEVTSLDEWGTVTIKESVDSWN